MVITLIALSLLNLILLFLIIKLIKDNRVNIELYKNLLEITKNNTKIILDAIKIATDRYSYMFEQFSKYLSDKDQFILTQIESIVNHESIKQNNNLNPVKPTSKNKSKKTENFDIDIILDKISELGYDKLSKSEKDFLNSQNNKL